MKIAIMQPYFFPYIGYYQLIKECDLFVVFNDVQFIRQGWINRNRVYSHNKEFQFLTVPVVKTKRSELIKNIIIDKSQDWQKEHTKILLHAYGKNKAIEIYKNMPTYEKIQDLAVYSMSTACDILGIKHKFLFADQIKTQPLSEDGPVRRILEICKSLHATEYLNLPGGRSLYSPETFEKHSIKLKFIEVDSSNKLSILDHIFRKYDTLHRR